MPTAQELNARPYATNPFAAGFVQADFAAQHAAHGEPFRLFEPIPLPPGTATGNRDANRYVEVELNGARALFYQTTQTIQNPELGQLPAGQTHFSLLPEVALITRQSRILRPAQTLVAQLRFTRSATAHDTLPQRFPTAATLYLNGSPIDPDNYEIIPAEGVNDSDYATIHWKQNAPIAGTLITGTIHYQPLYKCLGDSIQSQPLGSDGLPLPQRVLLQQEVR